MNDPILFVPPVINVIVTGLFAGVIVRQYVTRRRIYQLYWSIALSMAFLATLAYIGMIAAQPTSGTGVLLFRLYYILGGALMPAWLGLGSIALVSSPRVTRISVSVLTILSVLTAVLILLAEINMTKLSQIAGTPGTGTIQPGAWLVMTIILNTLGVVAVVGVALYSGWKLMRRQSSVGDMRTSNVLWANILILIGALLNAAAGTLARLLGVQNTFWLIMAVGWIVLFVGVLLANRRSSSSRSSTVPQEAAQLLKR
ncbi:MAG TPA: hypothetical protein VKY19_29620 [Ktedonosporobacter sp.]|jgi:hypothetical protein|nr:hypothetical protein [Ktedonosporobacter sp.]